MPATTSTCHYYYIHQVFGQFVNGIASFLKNSLFDQSTEVVIGTYDKAVQRFKDRAKDGGEHFGPGYPFICVDPMLDFEPEQQAGMFLYQYPNYQPKLAADIFGPDLYNDGNVQISPVINRYKGSFEVTVWCRSVYEYLDLKMLIYQFFAGGNGRIITPTNISGYWIVPDSYVFYKYEDPYRGVEYTLDWSNTNLSKALLKSINQEKWIYPFTLLPWLRLESISDMSEKFGADDLAEYKLSFTMSWETVLPTHFVLVSYMGPFIRPRAFMSIQMGVIHRYTNQDVPYEISNIYGDDEPGAEEPLVRSKDLTFKERLIHIVTSDEVNKVQHEENFYITLPYAVEDNFYYKVYLQGTELKPGYDYILEEPAKTRIRMLYVQLSGLLQEDNIIDVFIYTNIT